jgi:HEPN domain-containing protein
MKNETQIWLDYSEENLKSAKILLESELFNPCLQNVQQSIEKALKALLVENSITLQKTHNISELKNILLNNDINVNLSEEDCEFLDSIYLPSKYPVISVLPDYSPDREICNNSISIADNVFNRVRDILFSIK